MARRVADHSPACLPAAECCLCAQERMSVPNGMGSLTTILKRLEAATSRLEDLAVSQAGSVPAAGVGGGAGGPASAVSATTIGQPSPTSAVDNIRSADQSPAVKDFDALRQNALKQYVTLSNQLGGITAKQVSSSPSRLPSLTTHSQCFDRRQQSNKPSMRRPTLSKWLRSANQSRPRRPSSRA